jgi:hypothetical protein
MKVYKEREREEKRKVAHDFERKRESKQKEIIHENHTLAHS